MVEAVTWLELVRRSGSPTRARSILRQRVWRQVLRDAYVLDVEADTPDVRAAAARLVLPVDVALSHRAGLWILGEDVLDRGVLDVTVPRGRHLLSRPGLRCHIADLPMGHLVMTAGGLAVSAARAFVDVSRSEGLGVAVAFGDRALRSGATSVERIEAALGHSAGLPGVRAARDAVKLLDGRSESWMESLLRVSLHLGGVRGLDVQHDVYDEDGHVGRADLHGDGVWVEYDGRASRLVKAVFVAERRRQTHVAQMGFELRRFTSADVFGRSPAGLAAVFARAVALSAGRDRSAVVRGPDTLRPPRLRPLPTLGGAIRQAA